MAETVIVGGGVVGLGLGMLLAKDGHVVTLLERDEAAPPPDADAAWDDWERTGVNQFRLPHLFLARYRNILEAELPEVLEALLREGAVEFNPLRDAPESMTGGFRPDDERRGLVSGRRAMVERVVATVAQEADGLEVRRGVAVTGLLAGSEAAGRTPHVVGVKTDAGEELRADLVIDCCGRRSQLPAWLAAIGAPPPVDVLDDSGFIYYGRHFRSPDGALPPQLGPGIQDWGSISSLTLPADNGTWSIVLVARAGDRPLLGLRDTDRWEAVVRSLPTVAHWLDAEPLEDRVVSIAKIEDRHRDLWSDGAPVATGVVAVADAWACTNPSLGRGVSIGTMHAQALRDTLREVAPDRPLECSEAFRDATAATVEPWWAVTNGFDRHRLAEMAAIAEGRDYEPDDPAFEIAKALNASAGSDPELLRALIDISLVLELPEVVFARPGVMDKVIELGADWRSQPSFGPDREQLLAMANA